MGEEVKVVLVRDVSDYSIQFMSWIRLYEDIDCDCSYQVYVKDRWERDRVGEVVVLRKTDELVGESPFYYWEEVEEA